MPLRLSALRGHIEPLLAVASFGASSLFWLGLAFVMPVADYGRMMTLQAAIFLAVTLFSTRTHDLFFFLQSQHKTAAVIAYRTARACEVSTGIMTVVSATLAALVMTQLHMTTQGIGTVALISALQAIGAAQGASVGRLRQLRRGDAIARADVAILFTWLAVGVAALLVQEKNPALILVLSTLPNIVRTSVLILAANRATGESAPATPRPGVRTVIDFLVAGQLANFFKNGAVSIETMILAAFTSPSIVALYRLARAMLGAPVAAMNIYYQRSFPSLANATTDAERSAIVRQLQRNCVLVCLAMYPVAALIATFYARLKPDVDLGLFQLIVAGATIGLIPVALQQGPFARLAVAGRHHSVSFAYLVSAAVLGLISSTLFLVPSIIVFLLAVILSGAARSLALSRVAGQ